MATLLLKGDRLTGAGWRGVVRTRAFPVEVEGTLDNGETFYFRARHGGVELFTPNDDAKLDPDVVSEYGKRQDPAFDKHRTIALVNAAVARLAR